MNPRALTWTAAVSAVGAALLWQARDLVTNEVMVEVVFVVIVVAKCTGLTLLCWVFGGGLTEAFKQLYLDQPWSLPDGPRSPEVVAHVASVKRHLYGAAIVTGGIPLWLLMLAAFWPPTVFQGALEFVYGIGVGGLALPGVYTFATKTAHPALLKLLGKTPQIRYDADGNPTGVRLPDEDTTRIITRTKPGDPEPK